MSGTGGVAGADHGWLAKLLAGDPLACGVLDLARSLPEAEWDAFARSMDGIKAGMATEGPAALQQERSGDHSRFG